MAEYLISGLRETEQRSTVIIQANSSEEAIAIMTERGYRELTLHTDDVSALYTKATEVSDVFSADEYLGFQTRGTLAAIFFMVKKIYRNNWLFTSAIILYFAYRFLNQPPSLFFDWSTETFRFRNLTDWLLLSGLFLPILVAAINHFHNPARDYQRFIEHECWGRWQAVLDMQLPDSIPADDVAFHRANALASLGKIEEALQLVAHLENRPELPTWLFYSRLSTVYDKAKDHGTAFAMLEKSVELDPDNSTALIDLAMNCVSRRQDFERAEQLMRRARKQMLSEITAPFATYVDGLIALRRGQSKRAIELLCKSIVEVTPYRPSSPMIDLVIDEANAMMAIAHATLGDFEQSRPFFLRSHPRLVALDLRYIIDEYIQADPAMAAMNKSNPYQPSALPN